MNFSDISRVLFTWALPGGLRVEFKNGARRWIGSAELVELFGEDNVAILNRVAHNNGFSGQWVSV